MTRLIQLYILGVFLSFTLSQAGMVRHWAGLMKGEARPAERRGLRRKQIVNGTGAVVTGLVFVIVLVTKFAEGAWIVVLAAPVLFAAMKAVVRHYRQVNRELSPSASGAVLPGKVHAVVLVSNLLAPTPVRSRSPRPRLRPPYGRSRSPPRTWTTHSRVSGKRVGSPPRSWSSSPLTARPSARCANTSATCDASTRAT